MNPAPAAYGDLDVQRMADAVMSSREKLKKDSEDRQDILLSSQAVSRQQSQFELPKQTEWPQIDQQAFHGLAGDVVNAIAPHTEADKVALLVQILVAFGNCVGRKPYYQVEGDKHYPNLFAVLVGETSKSRKGTSWGRIRQLFSGIKEEAWLGRVVSGLSSGEGLICSVQDGNDVEPGVTVKRLLVVESEFANILRVLTREGNTLSRVIRDAWDRGDLAIVTKNSPVKATGAHISIVGHVTADELRRYLDRTETANGFANRFLYLCVKRSKTLPFGGDLPEYELSQLASRLEKTLDAARQIECVEMSEPARGVWAEVYPDLSEGQPGLFGAVIGRAEAQVIRLALIYALLDRAAQIEPEHLGAAIALWEYAESSAGYVFGSAMGDPVADDIRRALKEAGNTGLSRTDISDLFKRHRTKPQIDRALSLLSQHRKAVMKIEQTDGRPVERWRFLDG